MAELFDFGAQESPKSLSHLRLTHFLWLLVGEHGPRARFKVVGRQGSGVKYENGILSCLFNAAVVGILLYCQEQIELFQTSG